MKFLELSDFFKNKGKIKIFFSDPVGEDSFNFFKNIWFFIDKQGKLLEISTETKICLNNKPFNINKFHHILMNRKEQWSKDSPFIDFPNIEISSEPSKISYYKNIPSLVFINYQNLDSFEFVLNHELGHLFYQDSMYQRETKKVFNKQKGKISWIYVFSTAVSLFWYIYQKRFSSIFLDLTSFLIMFNSLFFCMLSYIETFYTEERLIRFSEEFFCDYFAFCYSTQKDWPLFFKNSLFENSDGFTHPSPGDRKLALSKYKISSIELWKNPILDNKNHFLTNKTPVSLIFMLDFILKKEKKQNDKKSIR